VLRGGPCWLSLWLSAPALQAFDACGVAAGPPQGKPRHQPVRAPSGGSDHTL